MMEDNNQYTGYKGIFKTTALFGSVQVFKILIGMIKNKLVALLLGPEGMGIIGIFQTAIRFIQTGAGLGVNQSAVRDISEANTDNDKNKYSRIIVITKRIVLFTGLLGCIVTIVISPILSKLMMGDSSYTISFILLSAVIAFNIITEGQLGILKGMRQLRSLAKATLISSIVGLIAMIPLIYFFKVKGIVPGLIISSGIALYFTNIFVKKISYNKEKLKIKELFKEASPMLKMGIALMFVTFLQTIVSLIIAAFIRDKGGINTMGYYSAGITMLNSYFGVIITALMTDYYPRIAAINKDNVKIQNELNKQSAVSLVLICPLLVFFIFFMPLVIQILYTKEFFPTLDFLKYGIYGTLITICSNQIDMILVAKFKIKLYTIVAIVMRTIHLLFSIILFNYFGLKGLGIMFALRGIIHLIIVSVIVYKLYNIKYNNTFVMLFSVVLILSIVSSLLFELQNEILRYSMGSILVLMSMLFSYYVSKRYFELDFIKIIKGKIK